MKKEIREVLRMAKSQGLKSPKMTKGDPHFHLIGTHGGREVRVVVSITKAFATQRHQKNLRLNIRKAITDAHVRAAKK